MLQFLVVDVVDVVAELNLDVKTSPDKYLLNIDRFPHLPIGGVWTQEACSTVEQHPIERAGQHNPSYSIIAEVTTLRLAIKTKMRGRPPTLH